MFQRKVKIIFGKDLGTAKVTGMKNKDITTSFAIAVVRVWFGAAMNHGPAQALVLQIMDYLKGEVADGKIPELQPIEPDENSLK